MDRFISLLTRCIPLAIILAIGTTAIVPISAVDDVGLFELDTRAGVDGDQDKKNDPIPGTVGDGNTIDEAAPGDDWATIYADYIDDTPAGDNSSAFALSWVEDTFANNNIDNGAEPFVVLRTPEDTFFTGGGSKDTNGIQAGPWKYKVESDVVPDKNDIVNAFAAAYDFTYPVGHPRQGKGADDETVMFYFGLDTFSVNGDANAGFWFFRQPVSLGPLDGDTGLFIGEHTDGDIFVAVAYTQGGSIGDIDVYEWIGNDATGSLTKILEGQDCATASANDDVCGVINKLLPDQTFGEDPVFDYANTLVANNPTPFGGDSYKYESAAFVEFGLDVEAVLGGEIGCFTTFLAETRSSQSETAQLKDFAFGAFPICSIAVDKTGDTLSKIGDDVDYTITVTNTGKATLYKQSITDNVLGDLTGDAGCGASLAPGASCVINVSRTVEASDPDPLDNTVTVVYTEFADPASLSFTDSDDHSVNLFQPSITFDKTGDATLSKMGDTVNYTLTLTNTSSADTPDLVCTITDNTLGVNGGATLASSENHVINESQVMPASPDPYINTATVSCEVDGFGNILEAEDSWEVNLFQPSVIVDKSGDSLSKVGDEVDYTITVTNDSSSDSPDLINGSISDTLLGDLLDGANPYVTSSTCSSTLASGASCIITASRTVQPGDSNPLPNMVTVHYNPEGFTNDISHSDDHSVALFAPDYSISAACDPDPVTVGQQTSIDITITNLSSGNTPNLDLVSLVADAAPLNTVDLKAAAQAAIGCDPLAASCSFSILYTPTSDTDIDTLITSVYSPEGFSNQLERSTRLMCDIQLPAPGTIIIDKVTIGGDGTFPYSATGGAPLVPFMLTTSGGITTACDTGSGPVACTEQVFANVPTVYNGTAVYSVTEILSGIPLGSSFVGVVCTDSVNSNSGQVGTSSTAEINLEEGETVSCTFTNEFPGEGCTPGYWRNHLDEWAASGYSPGDDFDTTFGVDYFNPDITLGDAINLGGGGVNKVARHGTAALISAAHPGVNYPYTVAQVIAIVQSGNVDPLVAANEQGCPLN